MVKKNIIRQLVYAFLFIPFLISACGASEAPFSPPDPPVADNVPGSIGYLGNKNDAQVASQFGLVIMGGGKDVDAAFQWMINRAKGGDFVILRASGTDAYNSYVHALGDVNSVQTLLINSRSLAEDETVAQTLRNAEMLFIAGGDQSNYMRYWKGTKVADAINYLANEKKVPIGGTSAGAAILGSSYYSGEHGSIQSSEALADPYQESITLYKDDFLKLPFLENVLIDQHYITRARQGRHITFLARGIGDWNIAIRGIGVDERTAVCIDESGKAIVLGSSTAYFIQSNLNRKPEELSKGKPLHWKQNQKALEVDERSQSSGEFPLFPVQPSKFWYVENGSLNK